jgi:hypothetical protein
VRQDSFSGIFFKIKTQKRDLNFIHGAENNLTRLAQRFIMPITLIAAVKHTYYTFINDYFQISWDNHYHIVNSFNAS